MRYGKSYFDAAGSLAAGAAGAAAGAEDSAGAGAAAGAPGAAGADAAGVEWDSDADGMP